MIVPASFVPDRLAPVQGVPLKAADLRDLLALADHQRRRHTRALHDTWGIAAGLNLDENAAGEPTIQPGVAYDRCGRLLVLPAAAVLPPPERLPETHVVALRADVAAGEPVAILRVLAPGDPFDPGLDVALGLVQASPDGDALSWLGSVRRYVRTAAPVLLAAGRVRQGTVVATAMPVVDEDEPGPATAHEWSAWIDVDAGFDRVPVYTAGVAVARPPGPAGTAALATGAATSTAVALGPATVQISEPGPHGFRITARRAAPPGSSLVVMPLRTNPEDIAWVAALPQMPADVRDPIPPTGPCPGHAA